MVHSPGRISNGLYDSPVHVPHDDQGVAELSAASTPGPWTVSDLEEWRRTFPPDGIQYDLNATNDSGTIVANAYTFRFPWSPPGEFRVDVLVRPDHRRRGLGGELLSRIADFAAQHGATRLTGVVRVDDEASVRFVKARGFRVERHEYESMLDLTKWDESLFAAKVSELEKAGIRFLSFTDHPCEEPLYELAKRNAQDLPGYEPGTEYPSIDEWRKRWLEDPDSPLDCIILAVAGENPVGVTRIGKYNETGTMKTWHTSVLREFRGKGIALALKIMSIRAALRHGAHTLVTNNDSRNVSILRVNEKLGFVPKPGVYHIQREVLTPPAPI